MEETTGILLTGLKTISVGNDCQVRHSKQFLHHMSSLVTTECLILPVLGISWGAPSIWESNISETVIEEVHSALGKTWHLVHLRVCSWSLYKSPTNPFTTNNIHSVFHFPVLSGWRRKTVLFIYSLIKLSRTLKSMILGLITWPNNSKN